MAPSPESAPDPVELANTIPAWDLNPEDLAWIREYLPASGEAEAAFADLDRLGSVGSTHKRTVTGLEERQTVHAARQDFLLTLGIPSKTLATAQSRSTKPQSFLIPTSSFVAAQRFLYAQGIEGMQLRSAYRLNPTLLAYSAENWTKRYDQMEQFFVENPGYVSTDDISPQEMMRRIIRRAPRVLNEAPKALSQRINHLASKGITIKTIKQQPAILTLNADTLQEKIDQLETISDTPWAILNRAPSLASLSTKSITSRVENLEQLGLDAKVVVARFPKILTAAEPSVRFKAAYIRRMAGVLGWDGDTNALFNAYPAILSSGLPRLRLLARILAMGAHPSRIQSSPSSLAPALITPIESYIIALTDKSYDPSKVRTDIVTIAKSTTRMAKTPANRKQLAQEALPTVKRRGAGRIALMYEKYGSIED